MVISGIVYFPILAHTRIVRRCVCLLVTCKMSAGSHKFLASKTHVLIALQLSCTILCLKTLKIKCKKFEATYVLYKTKLWRGENFGEFGESPQFAKFFSPTFPIKHVVTQSVSQTYDTWSKAPKYCIKWCVSLWMMTYAIINAILDDWIPSNNQSLNTCAVVSETTS